MIRYTARQIMFTKPATVLPIWNTWVDYGRRTNGK